MRIKIFLSLLLLLTACRKTSSGGNDKQILRINVGSDLPSLDPRRALDAISCQVCTLFFEGLTRITSKSLHDPAIAEKIDISEDKKTYTFHMKKTLWSDGSPLTAADFEISWKTVLSPDFPAPNADMLYLIKNAKAAKEGTLSLDAVGIHAINDYTLIVELEAPAPYFLQLTSSSIFLPTPHKVIAQQPDWHVDSAHSVTNGPFLIKKYNIHDQLIVEKNPHYWDAAKVKLDEIHISFITNGNTVIDLFNQKQLDLVGYPFTDIPGDCLSYLAQQQADPFVKDTAITRDCCFNTHRFPFINKNIRKAFAYAINHKEIADALIPFSNPVPGYDSIPPLVKGGKVVHFFKDEDNYKAQEFFKQGLKELGITRDAFPAVTLLYSNEEAPRTIAQILQARWREHLGIEIQLETFDFKVYLDKLTHRGYQCALSGWVYYILDPINSLERYKYANESKNYTGWENAQYISLLDASTSAADVEARFQLLERAEAILMDEVPMVPLLHEKSIFLFQPNLKNVYVSPLGSVELTYAFLESEEPLEH